MTSGFALDTPTNDLKKEVRQRAKISLGNLSTQLTVWAEKNLNMNRKSAEFQKWSLAELWECYYQHYFYDHPDDIE